MNINEEITSAINDLNEATERLFRASVKSAEARKDEIAATNAVNEAQKNLDCLYAQLRKAAPNGTDWKRQTGEPADA